MQDFREFLRLHLVKVLLAGLQFLEGLHDGLGHSAMRFGGPADDSELLAGGDPLVAVVVVEAEPQQGGSLGRFPWGSVSLLLWNHAVTVSGLAGVSSGFSA